jgi:glyoxylase-like metal-dependent hydrolase (beta-lactamase superfamily II)
MTDSRSNRTALRYAIKTAQRPGVTRDLPYGPADLQWVANSSTLVHGSDDAVLVDTFTSIDQNAELVDWVKSFDKNLTYICITHGHGDHFFGLKQLLAVFPNARAVGTRGTVEAAHAQGGRSYIESFSGKLFPGQIPAPLAFPRFSTELSSNSRDISSRSSKPASPTRSIRRRFGCPTSA